MKSPKPIKALAIIKKNILKFSAREIYNLSDDIKLNLYDKEEQKCEVFITFIKYIK